ncbi:hypothetical protein SAMN05216559_3527 [Halomicrobium zhouii]|uniref:Trypsin-like peptidase domain-containing protein n=1 Tax=Halomicrobium zhouii TaxID=767519 RepID=A0A1I6LZE2_9EURY|nr:hypothetical protein [Halomicrobium zhouii]SFS08841.1 hypothetical protein SAMN05216559_3527 [Halomicrobium zhouii]
MDVPEEIRDELEACANVVGTAWGEKRVNDQAVGEDAVVVLVRRKVSEAQLDPDDRIPKEVDVDGRRVKTDVQEVGDVRAQATATRPASEPDRERRWRPAPAGVSLGHPEITAGTLGSPALETEDGQTVVLTNAHVAAPLGVAREGDEILQPGPADGGSPGDDVIGTLAAASEIAAGEPNTTDSAIVAVHPGDVSDTILGVGEFAGFTGPRTDATYTKSGRTTGVTTGELRARDVRIRVGGYHDEPTVFEGVDLFGPMSAGGDSGSLVGIVDGGFRATHLLFAGSDRATIATPMDAVEAEHGELTPHRDVGGDGGSGDGGENGTDGNDDGRDGDGNGDSGGDGGENGTDGNDDGRDGDGNGDSGGDGGDDGATLAEAVGHRLQSAYGADAVTTGSDVEYRVTGAVQMAVAVADGAADLAAAAGRAIAATDGGDIPVLAYPANVDSPVVERIGNRVALLPVEAA